MVKLLILINDPIGKIFYYWGDLFWSWILIQGVYSLCVFLTTENKPFSDTYFGVIFAVGKNLFIAIAVIIGVAMACGIDKPFHSMDDSLPLWFLQYITPIVVSVAFGTYSGFEKNKKQRREQQRFEEIAKEREEKQND